MRPYLQVLALLAVWVALGDSNQALAQTPTLEFAAGAGNPTGTGPTITSQVITFQNNTDNPTGNSFAAYTPSTTATFAFSNEQYASGTNRGVMFGGATGTVNYAPGSSAVFPLVNSISGSVNTNYTATNSITAGTGINTASNSAVELFTDATYLNNTVTANTRYRYADITITFSQPMVNPVLHVTGLGSSNGGAGRYTTELDLLTTGVTLSKLSGSGELNVNASQILNSAGDPDTGTGTGAASGSVLVATPSAGITSLQFRIYLRTGNTVTTLTNPGGSTGDGWLLAFSKLTPTLVTGTVFEDVNYGGGAGRPSTAAGAVARPGATVELYDNAGNFVATTTTDASGQYTFNVPAATYTVRVVNRTVTSSRTGYVAGLLPVQTYNGTTTRVGGENPGLTDSPANTGTQTLAALTAGANTPESIATVTPSGATFSGPDFGFNFDVVVNTNDAGQGSLRQFITNANTLGGEASLAQAGSYTNQQNLATGSTATGRAPVALPGGVESSIFMIPASALTSGVAIITPASTLPTLTGANTALNAATQTFNIGNTNDQLLGVGGTVGTNGTALGQLNGPEVQIVGNSAIAIGLNTSAVNTTLRGLAIYGFGNVNSGTLNTFDNDNNACIRSSANGLVIDQNIVGAAATSFALPGTTTNASNIRLIGGTSGIVISNNLIGFANGKGIAVGSTTTNVSITNNEIRTNGLASAGLDGIDIQGNTTTVANNLLTGTSGQGVDSYFSSGGNTITGNTITDNGRGTASIAPNETPGVRIYGTNNNMSQNIISDNYGAGIMVQATSASGAVANTTVMSANSIFNNGNVTARNTAVTGVTGQIGIDLQVNNTNEAAGTSPFVTLNSATTTGANSLINYPILRTANIVGTNLILTGYAKAGAVIELFTAQANPAAANATGANFGQGRTFLTSLTEGVNDNDATTGQSYSGPINGFSQGTDANANGFSFTIPLASLPGGTLPAGTLLTSTATLGRTSEFSGNVTAVAIAPLTGYVYEDVNYGGGAGRSRTTLAAAAIGRPGAKVELYTSAGTLVGTAITDATGQYAFNAPVATGYTVRVVNSSVLSSRPGATAASGTATTGYVSNQLAVQTYNGTTTRVGGENPLLTDAAANTGSQSLAALTSGSTLPESIATVSVGTGATNAGPDFGFNFDVVVNTNDAGQGSLRQFITNANALGGEASLAQAGSYTNAVNLATGSTAAGRAGVALPAGFESSIFMIPAIRLTNGVALITPASALPQITGANTSINGGTQTFNIGNTNDVLLGTGGTVGTTATALSQLNGPEVQLVGSTAVGTGLDIAGAGSRVRGLAIYGFGNNVDDNNNANITTSANNVLIADNTLGSTATSFAAPAVANVSADVRVSAGTGLSFTNNLVGFAGGTGIYLAPAVTGTTITGNEIRGNGRIGLAFDGIDSHGSSTTATGNLFADGGAQGFDSFSSTGSNNVTGNTFTNNGTGNANTAPQETAAARFYGTGNTFSQNVSTGNYGAGVEVASGTTTITRNSIYNNGNVASANGTAASGQIGIDLLVNGNNENTGNSPFVTLNSTTTTGANGLLNYPILRTANIVGTNLILTGYAKAGAVIELFTAQANPAAANATGANFGQGRTFLTSLTEGVNDNDATTGQSYSGPINGFNQGTDANANGFSFTIPLASLPGGTLPAGTLLTSTATLSNATSEFSGNVTAVAIAPLTGYVYEDVNYGGGAGRSRTTLAAAAIGRPGAKVELYTSAGTLVGTAITDANGQYVFNAPVGTGYTVRVVNNSVISSRAGASVSSGSATTGYVSNQLAVQTYSGTISRVGGENPLLVDAAANTGSQTLAALTSGANLPQSIATVSVGTGTSNAGPDFGFNFDVVVNTNNTGQGSLAQFITNANALGGEASLAQAGSNNAGLLPTGTETSIFMIPSGAAVGGLLASTNGGPASQLNANGVAALNVTTALPTITGQNTSIDGTTQTINIGNTNNVTLGAGGTVGTSNTALGQLNGPEVQLKGTQTINGITMTTGANNTTVRGLSVYGFSTNILGGVDNTGTRIEQNVLGSAANVFADPTGTNRTLNEGINLNSSDNGNVINNLIGFNGGMGIWVVGNANNNLISGNEIRGNAITTNPGNGERLVFDGIELQGNSTGNTVSGNLITANIGHGIDSFGNGIGGNTVTGNTISNNGVGVASNTGEEGSGLRVFGATNPTIISNNVLTGNNGSGVFVTGSANQVTISQNSTSGNTRLGIDLISETGAPVFWNGNTGATANVTLNDTNDSDTGGNGLLNFPVLTTANVSGTSLVINGYARPGSLVELFLATPLTTDPTNSNRNFGQGSSFLISRTEGLAADDSNTGTGSYSGLINGVDQGSDNTNQFTFTIPLSSLTPAQRTALLNGSAVLTSTATLANSTSEFSGNLPLPVTDVTTALTGPATLSPGVPSGTYTATFTNEGPATATGVTRKVTLPAGVTNVVLPTGASLTGSVIDFDNGTPVTLANGASSSFSFSFTPATTATSSLAIVSNVTTTTSQGNNVAPDASTINATVAPAADVFASIAATNGTVAAGTLATAGTPPTFTVTFNNNGPTTAAGVAASVQLPAGLTGVSVSGGGSYDNVTGLVTYPTLTSIASGTPTTSTITFTAPATGPVVASATISTTSNEAGRTANNSQSATMTITPAFDLTTTLTGPASAVASDLVTLAVTTTNNGPSAVANAVQTVQLATGLTNVYVSNGGVYNPATSTQTIVSNGVSYSVPAGGVVFPTLATLASGQTVANSVSYAQPGTAFAPSALVTPNTASNATTVGDTNTGNNTAFLNGAASSTTLTTATAAAGTANAYTSIRSSVATTTVGGPVTLTVVTGNNGPAAATGVIQTVQVLPGFSAATIQVNGTTGTPSGNVITFGTGGPTYNTLTGIVTFPTLTNGTNGSTSGTSTSNTITFLAPASTGNNGQLLAMAAVSTTNTDPVAADNVASVGVTLLQTTDLVTTISGPASATPGQTVEYAVSFLNNGPMTATGVTETAQFPASLGTVTITDAAGNAVSGTSYNATTGLVTFPSQTTLTSGLRQVYKVSFAALAQTFTPRSTVTSSSADGVATNNSAAVTTSVAAASDLAVTVSGPATAVVGNAVTYSVVTTNNGPLTAPTAGTTLQLTSGFSVATLQVNGQTGTLNTGVITYANGETYNVTSGLVTFASVTNLAVGASASNYATFVMPNATGGQTTGVASATLTGNVDPTAANNSRSVATSVAPTTTTSADVTASINATTGPVAVSAPVTFTATYGNIGTDPAVNVRPTLQLNPGFGTTTIQVAGQAGTLSSGVITFPNGATYSTTTGLVTFPTIASQATGAGANVSYAVQVTAPANGPLRATAATTTDTSEPATAAAQTNDVFSTSLNVTPLFDAVTSVSGPASALPGASLTYTVTTTNNGPSPSTNATTQTVTVPAGQTPTNITNGGVYSSASNNITWTVAAGQPAGSAGAVANSFTVTQPTAGFTYNALVSVTGESNNGNNIASVTTSAANQPPLAFAVVNNRQSATGTTNNPMGNTVANNPATPNGLLISALQASDPESALSGTTPFTIVAIPPTTQGVLYYDNGGTYTAVTANKTLTATQATTLRFLPSTAFSGNASFTYLSTDAASNQSPAVNYTIPVAADQASAYVKYNSAKGGSNKYATNDVLAQTTDANTAVYTSGGIVYDATTGVLQSGASNGLPTTGTNAVLASGTLPTGVTLDPATGRIYVSNAALLPRITAATNYTVNVTTTDINGGTSTVPVTFTIGAYPLPVELKEFTAKAVNNLDAALAWSTASEKSNDHFDVERSFNGTDYVKIGQVKGQGSKAGATDYALTDAAVARKATGTVYYRLKQVDTDGTATYSPVRTVSFTTAATLAPAIALFPNPATSATQLDLSQLPAGTYTVQVLDATGRVVLSAKQEAGISQALDLNTIASGTYTVRVSGQSLNLTKRLIKE